MRLSLGFSSRNVVQTLSRWGAELRSHFFLGDEDITPRDFSFEVTDLSSSTAGIGFSNLQIIESRYIHLGNLCFWTLTFNVLLSADATSVIIAFGDKWGLPSPDHDVEPSFSAGVSPAFGRVYFSRAAAFGAVNLITPPEVLFTKRSMFIRPSPNPPATFYTAAGTLATKFQMSGFYFTKDLPRR